jgi:uncharacterized membrane protein YoaK (UPF0700 family)
LTAKGNSYRRPEKREATHREGEHVTRFYIFVIRVIMGAIFAVLLSRFFFPKASIGWVIAIGVFLVGLAYLSERFRKRKKEP